MARTTKSIRQMATREIHHLQNLTELHCNTPTTDINDIFIKINSNQLYA
jgi:hypothetical protein